MMSREGAISICLQILFNTHGNPKIIDEKVGQVPSVVPIRFDSSASAMKFIREHQSRTDFDGYFDGFWTNVSRREKERKDSNKNLRPLFKIKRAVLEVTKMSPEAVVVSKNLKEVYHVQDHKLRKIAKLHPNDTVEWDSTIKEDVKNLFHKLME